MKQNQTELEKIKEEKKLKENNQSTALTAPGVQPGVLY